MEFRWLWVLFEKGGSWKIILEGMIPCCCHCFYQVVIQEVVDEGSCVDARIPPLRVNTSV